MIDERGEGMASAPTAETPLLPPPVLVPPKSRNETWKQQYERTLRINSRRPIEPFEAKQPEQPADVMADDETIEDLDLVEEEGITGAMARPVATIAGALDDITDIDPFELIRSSK